MKKKLMCLILSVTMCIVVGTSAVAASVDGHKISVQEAMAIDAVKELVVETHKEYYDVTSISAEVLSNTPIVGGNRSCCICRL